jgi:uncharacterized protein (TIGR02452 family)
MYKLNRRDNKHCIYNHACIYSPNVPVIRQEDDGSLLETPASVHVVTCPAVNTTEARKHVSPDVIDKALRERMDVLLSVSARHQASTLVLGAFGCGVFGNKTENVAKHFAQLLVGKYRNVFPRVVFALLSAADVTVFQSALDRYVRA